MISAIGIHVARASKPILRDVSLSVRGGEIVGVFGPSGAGKSTLFRVLVGEEPGHRGVVKLGGEDVTRLPLHVRARRGLGYLPQGPSVLWDLTVDQNLDVYAEISGTRAGDLRSIATDLGLASSFSTRASALSGGERRRLELTRALATSSKVLLCDEPFAALDPKGAEAVAAKLRAVAGGGGAVVVADHHLERTLPLCDRATLLAAGELKIEANPADFEALELVVREYRQR